MDEVEKGFSNVIAGGRAETCTREALFEQRRIPPRGKETVT